ncbi:short-chain dehydrogenase [Staphylococcus gallinarum]|uniref:SDR family NAD(P)-dependent oxidoreductase n=1 Tax=Staphylococcus gallinarum TaxID=1293 RepID=UPI000D1E4E09|nr:SDR family NAD(P)-dependent oxidoreductase [Staphylococcus gallinarum]PTL09861.1 short-chain dehydrogenase [Staphylococcus gallinarum]RIL32832.1 SDR family NAD(P)-dependent oxidoreductase [Staphylococcus gallinarum]
MDIAIITGASSGLGRVFTEKIVERYKNLDEIWVIARREDKLKELAYNYSRNKFRILSLDLSNRQSFEKLNNLLDEIKPNIKLVINNAGFDRAGNFRNMENKDIYSIIDINTIGMSMISKCCLPYMYKGSFQIIVGSEGAYLPLPMRAVYGASKTYGRFFARALREEERNRGINILFMGTGAMNTEMFRSNASSDDVSNTKFLDLNKITVTALNRAEKNAAVYSPSIHTKATRLLGKIFPSSVSVKFSNISNFVPKNNKSKR